MARDFLCDVDLKAGLLLAGSAGTSGQVLKSQGPGLPAVWDADNSGGGGYYSQSTAPSSPAVGDRWLDTNSGIEYTRIADANSEQWVELGPVAGGQTLLNYDGAFLYSVPSPISGTGNIQPVYTLRLITNGSGVGPTIGDFFGSVSSISLAASSVYEIQYFVFLQKTTAGTLTWTLAAPNAPVVISAFHTGSPVTGVAAGAPITAFTGSRASTTAAFAATASITASAFMTFVIQARVVTNLATSFRLQATCSAGSVTAQAGSHITVRQISTTTGAFV